MKQLLITIAVVVLVGCGNPEADSALFDAVSNGNTEDTKKLIADGADVDAKDDRFLGQTPLHPAAFKGYKEIVELLIVAGADVNAKGYFSETPLYNAAIGGHREIVELLIEKGTDVNAKYDDGGTPLHNAAKGHKEIVELLIEKGADVNAKYDDGRTGLDNPFVPAEIADLLRKHGGKRGEELKAEGK